MATQEHISQSAFPTGEVTLLFTDIVGSSRLWEEHGDGFIPVWQTHDAVLRDAFARYGGHEVKSEGDAFMVVFADAESALECALFAQEALARYPWPTDIGQPRVRIGLHTGEPFQHGNDYFGPVVNRAAYICKAAHGGQVLLSEETRCAVADRMDTEVDLHDLGDFPLKDLGLPQRLHQAYRPGMEMRSFPPPHTLAGQPHNLPVQRTSFVGRAHEIEQIAAFLATGEKPVLTLTGPGGIGKTRLSLQAAASRAEWFPDGVWYIHLVEARDVVGAAVEIASAMHIPLSPAQPPLPQVRAWLANRHCLLILDDAGTLPQADRLIRELLSGSTSLRCLATSRESLQIAEADNMALTGLPTAAVVHARDADKETEVAHSETDVSDSNALAMTQAGRLFLERVAEVNPNLVLPPSELVAAEELLRRLEGVPASIERAAQLMDRVLPSTVLDWLNRHLAPVRPPVKAGGAEKLRGFLRRSAQKAIASLEEPLHTLKVNMGPLLQGIADVATDLRNEKRAAELGRESLRLSQEAGDELGAAAALRQLARIKWRQGDRQSAAAMLAVATRIYRLHNTADYPEIQRELDNAHEELAQAGSVLPAAPTFEAAVALAMQERAGG